jgi:hypothetical protein
MTQEAKPLSSPHNLEPTDPTVNHGQSSPIDRLIGLVKFSRFRLKYVYSTRVYKEIKDRDC